MPQPTESSDLIIGEMRGQLREVVHSVNNLSGKFDSLSREVMALATVAVELGKLQAKVDALEHAKARTDGERGAVGWIVGSPVLGWIAALIAAVVIAMQAGAN